MFLVHQGKNIKMRIDLNGKKALVGGSTGGIGKAIALELSKCGANVTLMARDREKLKNAITDLSKNKNSKHDYLEVDFNNFNDLKIVTADFFEKNTIDILVNNTQGPPAGGSLEKKIADYHPNIIHVNPSLGWNSIIRDFFFVLIARINGIKTLLFLRGWGRSSIHMFFGGISPVAKFLQLFFSIPDKIVVLSSKYKEEIDKDVMEIINTAYNSAKKILVGTKPLIEETSNILKNKKILKIKEIMDIIDDKYEYLHKNDFSEYLDLC